MDVQRICRNTVFTSVVSALCSGFTVFLLILGVTFICRSTRSVEYKANKGSQYITWLSLHLFFFFSRHHGARNVHKVSSFWKCLA